MSDDRPNVRRLIPLVWVKDIGTTVAFYRDRLGFTMAGSWEEHGKLTWCQLERGGAALMFQQPHHTDVPVEDRTRGVTLYFICDDADAMHVDLTAQGLEVAAPDTVFYAMRQATVFDPDGYEVCFESPVAAEP